MKQGVQYTNTTASSKLGRYNNVLKKNRICNFCQESNYANEIECEYHAF